MKKYILLTYVVLLQLQAMETKCLSIEITKNSFSLSANALNILSPTKIHVIKGYWEDYVDTVGIIVVGNHQQNMLRTDNHDNLNKIGSIYSNACFNSIYKRNKDTDSASDDETYKPHPQQRDKQTWRNAQEVNTRIMHIEEPCISNTTRRQHTRVYEKDCISYKDVIEEAECINDFVYESHIPDPNREDIYYQHKAIGDKAIQIAMLHLIFCYQQVLPEGIKYLQYTKEKNIGFPTLGADVGFPRDIAASIAITTILTFIKNNPDAYKSITFFLKKRSEFALYKKLILQHYGLLHNICLFYWAHTDHKNILACLPKDILHYIVRSI